MTFNNQNSIDFSYAFAPPHRLTICQPEGSHKTLLDVKPGKLRISWSYDTLAAMNNNVWKSPDVKWVLELVPLVDHEKTESSFWKRSEQGIPGLVNTYIKDDITYVIEAIGAASEDIFKISIINTGNNNRLCQLSCEHIGGWVISNPAWIDGYNPNALLAMEFERPDRILAIGYGADQYPLSHEIINEAEVPDFNTKEKDKINFQKTLMFQWDIRPGETKTGWLVRPYEEYEENIDKLEKIDWNEKFNHAKKQWIKLINEAVKFDIPDDMVKEGFQACLMDLFVMRERIKNGDMVETPGTKMYRSPNSFEPLIASVMLDQAGFHHMAEEGLKAHIDSQGADGNWADPKGWNHHMWGASGYKAWAIMEHYHLTGDIDFLEKVYPHMLASSLFQESRRKETRNSNRPDAEFGLLPRGMGDGGLMNGKDYFGVFYPHNFLAVFADKLTLEAAMILEKTEDINKISEYYLNALNDLNHSLTKGVICENDYEWIPGTPNKTSGSNWGALFSVFPCDILKKDNKLVLGTLKHIEKNISAGGLPLGIGWMKDGLWVAVSLDNIAQTYLMMGMGDEACRYLYPVFNHGTPLFTWCEERNEAAGTSELSGDLQHLWTPVSVARYIRDALVMERNGGIDLAMGIPREWLATGKHVGVRKAPTHFGFVTYKMNFNERKNE
ncbi:MAG: hypothetical protein JXQ23_05075, partial [Clostridia bacterium]|nr:hypothetical protein [Clostridia bacterium]